MQGDGAGKRDALKPGARLPTNPAPHHPGHAHPPSPAPSRPPAPPPRKVVVPRRQRRGRLCSGHMRGLQEEGRPRRRRVRRQRARRQAGVSAAAAAAAVAGGGGGRRCGLAAAGERRGAARGRGHPAAVVGRRPSRCWLPSCWSAPPGGRVAAPNCTCISHSPQSVHGNVRAWGVAPSLMRPVAQRGGRRVQTSTTREPPLGGL
jgi:hypothetical protein